MFLIPILMVAIYPLFKRRLSKRIALFDKNNAKICGLIIYSFMVKCAQGIPLPDIKFLKGSTISLTAEEKAAFDARKSGTFNALLYG
jgi:hypothetical protein